MRVIYSGSKFRLFRSYRYRPSAIYCPGLAVAFADLFEKHLQDYKAHIEETSIRSEGLESILCNDLCVGLEWKQTASWNWKRTSRINVREGKAALRLFSLAASRGGDVRLPFLCDSHVARSAIAKGRSPGGTQGSFEADLLNMPCLWNLPSRHLCSDTFQPSRLPRREIFQCRSLMTIS